MIRLVLVLCVGLFAALKIGGEDRGQLRFGLSAQVAQPALKEALPEPVAVAEIEKIAPAPKAATPEVINAAFVPDAPVMSEPRVAEATATPEPEITGRVMYVSVNALNVRAGPGTDYSVMDRLKRGDEVLVVAIDDSPDSWAMIRVEGDGIEGYVSAALLSE